MNSPTDSLVARLTRTVALTMVTLALSGCGSKVDGRVYFVASLYDGNVHLPGMNESSRDFSAQTTHEYKPEWIKFGSGQTFWVEEWTIWDDARAIGKGTYRDHSWVETQGNVILDSPQQCGKYLTFTHLSMSLTDEPVDTPDAAWPIPEVDITTC